MVDGFADAGGADCLVKGRQGQKLHLAPENGRKLLRAAAAVAAENNMVVGSGAAGTRLPVGRGVGNDITARYQVEFPFRQQLFQQSKILRHSDIDGNIVREQVGIRLVGDGNTHDLPSQQLGQSFLAPGEFVHCQIDLKATGTDLLHDLLVTHREGVEGSGEKGRRLARCKAEGPVLRLPLDDKAVKVVEHGGPVEEDQIAFVRLGKDGQQFFVEAHKDIVAALHGDPAVSQNAQAQDVQGRLVDGRFVVADAGHQNTEDVLQHVRPFLRQGGNGLSQSAHGHLGRKGGGSPRQFLQLADGLLQFLVRQQAHELPQIGRDEQGDLFLAGLQLTGQVDGDLIDLVHGQLRGNLQQMPARSLAHRQVLADGHQIGQVHGRVEGALRLLPHLPAQHLHLLQLDRPVDDVFQIAQVDLRDLLAGQRHKGLPQQKSLQIEEHGPVFILRRVIVQKHPLDDRPQSGKLLQMLQTAQADDLQLHLLAAEEFGEPPDERRALLLPEIPAGHVADGVDEGKAVEAPGLHSPVKERL